MHSIDVVAHVHRAAARAYHCKVSGVTDHYAQNDEHALEIPDRVMHPEQNGACLKCEGIFLQRLRARNVFECNRCDGVPSV